MIKNIYYYIENKFVLIFWIVVVLCFVLFIGDSLIHNRMSEKKFFLNTLTGEIKEVKHEVKGYYKLKVDSSWIYLSDWGECIDSIYIGDSIFKPSNSFCITLKRVKYNYKYSNIYDCTKWRKESDVINRNE